MPVTQEEFRAALSRFPSGVTVVTTKDAEGRLHGITVSAFNSVSLDPSLVLICIDRSTGSHAAISESGIFVVNILSSEQAELSERFAAMIPNKFDGVEHSLNEHGLPVLSNCIANLECRVRNIGDGGDHTIFVGEVENVSVNEGDPLVYFRSNYRVIGA
ncbi:MAG: flavin reductase family protein [Pyrinomonadaceae bacterium]|nr:flavin reductase family protein [Pyrinomonadaceae bacterium]